MAMAFFSSLLVLSILLPTTILSAAEQSPPQPPPLLLPLTHTLSRTHTEATQLHLLKTASVRSANRFHNHRSPNSRRQVSLPLTSGSDYTLSFSIGSRHSQTVELYMDTGSDLVWLPCSPLECILCEGKPTATPLSGLANLSSPVPCNSASCSAAHSSLSSSDLCAIAGCPLDTIETSTCSTFPCPPFYYAYGDGSLIARLRRDHLSMPAGSGTPLHLPNFTFGCAHTTLAEPVGVAGFGRGILSLPSQLAKLFPHLGKQFSYCLISHSFESQRLHLPSPLILGRTTLDNSDPFVYTPMLDNSKHPYFYSVGLEAISVGGTHLPALPSLARVDHAGNGGFVVDSGTTFTMLPADMYNRVIAEFDRRMESAGHRRAAEAESETGLGPCYYSNSSGSDAPSLVLHFAGNASVALPRRNYYEALTKGRSNVGCLMLMNGGDESDGGPAGTLGNIQQQGFEVVYDLEGRRVGFARKRCASLWGSLSRG